jgi:hypothetical protein
LILAKTRIRGQFVKPSTFHLSQHAATQREDTDLLPSRERAFTRALPRRLPSPSIPGVDIPVPGRRRCIAAPRAIFEWTMHFSGTRRNRFASLLSLSLSLFLSLGRDLARGNARGKRSKDRISKTTFGYLPIRWIDNARKARRKNCERVRGGRDAFP